MSLCVAGHEDYAIELMKKLSKVEFMKPDTYTYNFLVKRLVKTPTIRSVSLFINEMNQGFDVKPDLVTYTILFDNVCNGKNILEAMRLLDVLKEEGFKLDRYVFNTIMKGYKVMKENDMKLESVSYRTFLRRLCRNGKVAEAYAVFDYAVESKSLTEVSAYTTLESTLKWLKKAKEQGLAV